MRQLVRRFSQSEEGAGLTEYALIIALIAICLVGIVQLARNAIGDTVNSAAADVSRRSTASYGASGGAPGTPSLGHGTTSPPDDPDEEEQEPADSASASPDM